MRVCIKPLAQINSSNFEVAYALFICFFVLFSPSFGFETQGPNALSRILVKLYYCSPFKKKDQNLIDLLNE